MHRAVRKFRGMLALGVVTLMAATPAWGAGHDELDALLDTSADEAAPLALGDGGAGGGLDGLLAPGDEAPSAGGTGSSGGRGQEPAVTFSGYVKPLVDLEYRFFPDLAAFTKSESNQFRTAGVRTQLSLQGSLGDSAQFFSAVNLDFNEVASEDNTAASQSELGDVRLVEMYVDLFGESTRLRAGSQLVTWGFLDGFEVPTDRLNARDFAFKSNELEDLKLASTGVQFDWRIDSHKLELIYIPVAKVHRLPPTFDALFDDDLSEDNRPGVTTQEGKGAVRWVGSVGPVDYALSYIEGLNPWPDIGQQTVDGETVRFTTYSRYRSPGLDVQINFGGFLAKLAAASFTPDNGDDDHTDPLLQNPWVQVMAGVEFFAGSALVNLSVGSKVVEDFDDDETLFFTNALLNQPRGRTSILAGSFSDSYLTGNALELSVFFTTFWDQNQEHAGFRFRPSMTYNAGDGLSTTFIPSFSEDLGIRTNEVYWEVKYAF